MGASTGIKHYSDFEVLSSQPGIEAAMHLVRANALESGATADRMFLKVRAGSLAGLDLLWDQPSVSWVEKAKPVVLDHVCLCGAPLPAGVEQCEECRKGFGTTEDPDAERLTKSVMGILPWRVEFDQASHGESLCVVDGGGSILAKTPVPLIKTDEARVRMMAAAPKLLESLENALDYRRDAFEGDESVSGADLVEFFSIWRERAKIAIAAAKGGASC